MRNNWLAGLAGAAVLAVSCVLAGGSGVGTAGAADSAATSVCGSMAGQRPHITKVLWIFMENQSYGYGPGQIPGSKSDPYTRRTLTAHCGSTSDYHAVTHPSYPNYLAATSGSTQGVLSGLYYFNANSIFGQVDPSWRSYEEFMPVTCDHVAQTGSPTTDHYYVGGHNPAASYSKLPVGAPTAGDCRKYDEPLGSTKSGSLVRDVRNRTLPRFGFITPGLCDDMHQLPPGVAGCPNPIAGGDAWLATWIPIITAGPDYTAGHLVIDITWDEGGGGSPGVNCVTSAARNCLVPDIVISPYTRHVVSGTDFSHYSLLKMTETLLHVPYLGAAGQPGTNDLCVPFGLCPPAR